MVGIMNHSTTSMETKPPCGHVTTSRQSITDFLEIRTRPFQHFRRAAFHAECQACQASYAPATVAIPFCVSPFCISNLRTEEECGSWRTELSKSRELFMFLVFFGLITLSRGAELGIVMSAVPSFEEMVTNLFGSCSDVAAENQHFYIKLYCVCPCFQEKISSTFPFLIFDLNSKGCLGQTKCK